VVFNIYQMLWYIGENWYTKECNMKKQVAGFVAGAIFTLSATAFADDIQNLIGKTVQAQYMVEINGQTLNTVVVEGKNYAPVRSIGEAAGYEVINDGKNVILKEGEKLDTAAVKEKYRLERVESLKNAINNTEKELSDANSLLQSKKEESIKFTTDSDKAIYSRIISDLEKKILQLNDTLEKQNSSLAELQK